MFDIKTFFFSAFVNICLSLFFFNQNQAEVVEVAEEEVVAAGLWEWEAFSKAVCQNYAQLEVNSTVMMILLFCV